MSFGEQAMPQYADTQRLEFLISHRRAFPWYNDIDRSDIDRAMAVMDEAPAKQQQGVVDDTA
jgi:hypothetical protein